MSIQAKSRNCRECTCKFIGVTILCPTCTNTKKKNKTLTIKKEIDLNSLKGNTVNLQGKSKRPRTQEELELEKKQKVKEKELKAKERAKKRRETKKIEKQISITNLQVLYQRFIRLVTPDICSSCFCVTSNSKGGNQKNSGHMVEKSRAKSTALLVTNMYAQCWNCNNKNIGNGRPLDLYKFGCKFWGQEIMDLTHNMSKVSYSFDKGERVEMYEFVLEKIKEAETLTTQNEKNSLLIQVYKWQTQQIWFQNIINQI